MHLPLNKCLTKTILIILLIFNKPSGYAQDTTAIYRSIDSLQSISFGKKDSLQVDNWINIALLYLSISDKEKTNIYANKALENAKEIGITSLEARSYVILGRAQLAQYGPRDKATRYFLNALELFNKLKDNNGIATCYLQLGVLSFDMQNFEESAQYLLKALEYSKDNPIRLSTIHYMLALCYSELGRFTEAEVMFDLAESENQVQGDVFNMQVGAFRGKMYVNRGDYDLAITHLQSTINKYEGKVDVNLQAPAYIFLSSAYLGAKEYRNAIREGMQGYKLALCRGSYIIYLREAETNLYKAYKGLGNTDSAYFFLHELSMIKDSISSITSLQRVAEMKGKFEFEQEMEARRSEQALKDAIAAKELEREKLLRNLFIAGFILLIGVATLVYFQRVKVTREMKKSDALLLNILPASTASELKTKGSAEAKQFENVSVLFTDFVNFTGISQQLSPKELVANIHYHFTAFDAIAERYGLEKIKTIGDAYMAVCGLPAENRQHARQTVLAALEMARQMEEHGKKFKVRIGIHSGPVVAGIVGVRKFQYDIWGDTVNTASRMESNSEVGKVNISASTYALIREEKDLQFEYRGEVEVKGKGALGMYFVYK